MATRRKIPARQRLIVAARAQYRCEYCHAPENFSLDTFTIDHIIPLSQNGSDDPDNLAYACNNCNNRKHDYTYALDPVSEDSAALYNPRNDSWTDHFRWSENKLTIEPLTPTGRATIPQLQLNRAGVVNIRRALLTLNEDQQ